jgi:hypothetical protein
MTPVFGKHPSPPARYYIYVSDAKVEMLYEQLPRPLLSRLAAEVKVDLKVIGVTIKQAESQPTVRAAKLAIVERYLESQFPVGTIENPGSYFRGCMSMKWGWARLEREEAMALFVGHKESETVVLGGSRKHVLGEMPSEGPGASYPLSIVGALRDKISDDPRFASFAPEDEEGVRADHPPEDWLSAAVFVDVESLPQTVEFLARNLLDGTVEVPEDGLRGPVEQRHVTLGTPLFVALTD